MPWKLGKLAKNGSTLNMSTLRMFSDVTPMTIETAALLSGMLQMKTLVK